jgi:hypothetical protein
LGELPAIEPPHRIYGARGQLREPYLMISEREMRGLLAEALEALFYRLPKDQRLPQMRRCETLLDRASLSVSLRDQSPRVFSQDLFLSSPEAWPLVENALRNQHVPEEADSPSDLVASLLPSDHHNE